MHKSSQVKFVVKDEDVRFSKKIAPPLRIISGTALSVMDFDIKF